MQFEHLYILSMHLFLDLQMLDITKTDMNHILNHMGHTWRVHQHNYRQTSDVLERLDVAKLLLIQDSGMVGENRKKKLEDINLNEITFEGK